MPGWAAVVIATTHTAVGFAFDAGSGAKQLTGVFAALYVVGCVAAVLTVRQSGVFTAVIQPPLILFCAVPGAYWLFHDGKLTSLKDLLINCGYPLIERFPLMLFTSAGVLLIGMIRWYLGMTARSAAAPNTTAETAGSRRYWTALAARLTALLDRGSAAADDALSSLRGHAVGRTAKPAKPVDRPRAAARPAASRSRHVPPPDDAAVPDATRVRRRRPTPARDVGDPSRRPRQPRDPDLHGRPVREPRRDPYPREDRQTGRAHPYPPIEPWDPRNPYEPRRRPAPAANTATHHPISRVRYRSSGPTDEGPATPRRRRPRTPDTDAPEYGA
ncbi:DUF6542 domain-containing protein [Mycobacterium sp.]|uniref:DUF6542 domain-containing protein n=1 Tax=Mycobacterium sp. TaxID=1785 RepID=UPI0031E47251